MRINITKAGISFGSLVVLFSIGYFIGVGIPMILFAVIFLSKGYSYMPSLTWLLFIPLAAIQSILFAVMVAGGVKLYEQLHKFEVSFYEEKL